VRVPRMVLALSPDSSAALRQTVSKTASKRIAVAESP